MVAWASIQSEYADRGEATQDHQRVRKLPERVGQQFEAGIPMDDVDLFSRRIQKMNDREKCGNKDRRGYRRDCLANQAEDRSSEQGFFDEGDGNCGKKYRR